MTRRSDAPGASPGLRMPAAFQALQRPQAAREVQYDVIGGVREVGTDGDGASGVDDPPPPERRLSRETTDSLLDHYQDAEDELADDHVSSQNRAGPSDDSPRARDDTPDTTPGQADEEVRLRPPVQTEESLEHSRMSASAVRSSIDLVLSSDPAPQAQQPTPLNDPLRDRYGFKKQTQFVTLEQYDEWWASYVPYLRRRKRKWVKLMQDHGLYLSDTEAPVRFPPKSDKLKRYVRKGVPAEWRGNAWFAFARGHEKLSAHPGLYDKLCRQTLNLRNSDTDLIERDLHRTFPDNVHFRADPSVPVGEAPETPLISALRRVLTAFAVYQPKIGYCQSLNFIAGMLLLFLDEERAFWMLVIITQRYLPGVHEVNLEGVNVDQGILMLLIKQSLPEVWERIGLTFEGQHTDNFLCKLPPITLCTASWFMSAYISIFPTETMLRIWDAFFYEDSKVFFRIALTIFKLAEPEIASVRDQMEQFQIVQNLPKRMIDASDLMEHCFRRRNGVGHVSQEEIVQLRKFVAERRRYVSRLQQDAGDGGSSLGSNSDLTMLPTTDDEEFRKFRPDRSGKSLNNLTRRMRSLRVSSTIASSPSSIIKRRVSSLQRKPSNLSFATTS